MEFREIDALLTVKKALSVFTSTGIGTHCIDTRTKRRYG